MSNDKLLRLITQTIENEENYKKNIDGIFQGIAKPDKNYINGVMKITSEVLKSPESEIKRKFLSVQLIKDCMESKQSLFISSVAESDILTTLEKNIVSFPKTEEEIVAQYGPKPNNDNAKKFYILMMECIKYWAHVYENEREPLQRFSYLYKKLLSKGAKFPQTYYFIQKGADQAKPRLTPSNSSKDVKNVDKKRKEEEMRMQERLEGLSRAYDDILKQAFFYNAQELDIDDSPEEQYQDDELDIQGPFSYNAQALEVDEVDDDDDFYDEEEEHVIEEDEREQRFEFQMNQNVIGIRNQEQSGRSKKQESSNRSEYGPKYNDDDDDFDIVDQIKPNPSKVPPIKQFSERKGLPVNQNDIQKVYNKPPVQEEVIKDKVEETRDNFQQNFQREALPNSRSETNINKENNIKSIEAINRDRPKSGSLKDIEEQARPPSLKILENDKKTKYTMLKPTAQINESPEFRVGNIEEEENIKRNQTVESRAENSTTMANKNAANQSMKTISGNFDDRFDFDEERNSRIQDTRELSPVKKNDILSSTKMQLLKSDKKLEEDPSIEEYHIKVTKPSQNKSNKPTNYNAGSLRDFEETDKSQSVKQKIGSTILADESYRNKNKKDELEEIASRIHRGNEISREVRSLSELNLSKKVDDTKSFIEAASMHRRDHLKVLGDSMINGEREKLNKNMASPERQHDKNNLHTILPHEYTANLESFFEKELTELKRKNDKLLEENQNLKIKNAQLEVKLAQEVEKNQELKDQLNQKESELKASRNKIESYLSPKRTLVKMETPLSSPKSEIFKKKTLNPSKENLNGSLAKLYKSNPPPEKPSQDTRSVAGIGPFLRKKLEIESELYSPSRERPGQMMLKTVSNAMLKTFSNTMLKTEFASPKRNGQPTVKYLSPSPKTRRPFLGYEDLPYLTDARAFRLACLKDKETLFENEQIIVEFQVQLRDQKELTELEVEITYINKTQTNMKEFSVTYKSAPGFMINAENTEIEQQINSLDTQTHKLRVQMISPSDQIGTFIIEYRINEEPIQLKLHLPIIITKFLKLSPITSSDFIKKRKFMQTHHPGESEESPKVKLTSGHLETLRKYLFSKMVPIATDKTNNNRFTVYGGYIKLEEGDVLIRVILENSTQTVMVQVNFDEECREYATELIKMLIFLLNEKVLLL